MSVGVQIKLATVPELILRQIERLYASLAERDDLESPGNRDVTGSRRDDTTASSSYIRHDSWVFFTYFFKKKLIFFSKW